MVVSPASLVHLVQLELAAGDEMKKAFPECKIAALEPHECSTLTNGGLGQHRIEGIGDKMCTLIHNILTTDFIVQIHDDACVRGLEVIYSGKDILIKHGVDPKIAESMKELFGVSGICNILGAIKMAKYLKLGPNDNIVTIATDGFDRYDSVIDNLRHRELEVTDHVLDRWFSDVFVETDTSRILDTRGDAAKRKNYSNRKKKDWLKFGYSKEYLDSMRHPEFWEKEYAKIKTYDEKIKAIRGKEI